ncbi:hypothetical protein CHLRE_03g205850v5 [Chlamydomonas reinhardtii]|uniref:Protein DETOXIFICATION n=1 Tax=Chlamydomonas reinhardtii TaxID=3055 RepID=A0A2K3DZ02_CHLRE|nr:uncharacterized protein CHLRE_03g205850v5 [Chlamydomonas reinhardtii]PNW85776.1 hypothetical protein CHLRE_03g205850v5 [Chlamydomonas reinhardtii]
MALRPQEHGGLFGSRPVPGTSAFLCTTVRPVPLDSPARGILRSASLQRPSWAEPAFAAAAGVGAGPGISSQYRAAAATAAPSPLLRRRHQGLLAAAAASAGSPGGPSPAATPLSSSSEPPAGSAAGSDVVATNGNGANGAHTANGAHAPSLAAAGADGGSAAATAHAPAWEQKARAAAAAMMASGVDGEDDGAGAAPAAAPPPAKTRIQNAIDMATFALPLATQNVLGYSLNALSESLVGRLGASSLSASTLANSTYSLVGLSVVWGGAAGMETLCGQAYGAGNRRLMRLVLLRAVVVCWAVCVPVVALWSNAEPFLLMLGQNPTLVAASTEYLKALAPSMFAYVLAECVQTYLVVQGIVAPTTIAKAVVTVVGPLYYYGCMFWLDLGLVGAGYAYALCKATNAMLLLGWLGWRILRGPEQQQQQQHLASKEVAVAEGEEGAEGGAAGAAAALGKADASGGGPLKLADLRLVEAQKARAEQKKREQQQRLLEGRQGESSEGRRQKRGEHGMDGNAHEEILTPPLAAAASAPEFNLGHEGAMAAAKVESSGDASRRGTGTALAAAAAGTGTAAVAAAAMPTAWGGLLHGRGAEMWAAVKAEMVEVFDLRACWEYVKFGFPAAVMSCLEWWAYEALVIMAGWLPNAEVALGCLGICLTVSGWVYMVPQAISTAACTRVSNALGAGDAVTAKRNFQAAYGLVLVSQLAISACLLPNAARVARFFCPDPVAAALASTLLPITALNTIGDGMNCVLNGILRACGRQALGARLQLMTYWVCGLPLAYWAAFKMGLGVKGFVMAIGATSLAQSLLVGLLISRFNWDVEVRNSQQLLSTISSSGSSGSSGSADDASGADEGAVGEQGAAAGGRR